MGRSAARWSGTKELESGSGNEQMFARVLAFGQWGKRTLAATGERKWKRGGKRPGEARADCLMDCALGRWTVAERDVKKWNGLLRLPARI